MRGRQGTGTGLGLLMAGLLTGCGGGGNNPAPAASAVVPLSVGGAVAQTPQSPQGSLTIPTGTSVNGPGADAGASTLNLGGAFGDAMNRSSLIHNVMVLDGEQHAYTMDLSGQLSRTVVTPPLEAVMAPPPGEGGIAVTQPLPGLTMRVEMTEPSDSRTTTTAGAPPQLRSALGSMELGSIGRLELSQGTALADRLGLASVGRTETFLAADAFRSPFLGLAGDGTTALLERPLSDGQWLRVGFTGPATATAAPSNGRQAYVAEWGGPVAGGKLAVQVGTLHERGSVLATSGQGGFASQGGTADTRFVGLVGSHPLTNKTDVFGSFTEGVTTASSGANALLSDFRNLTSNAMGVGLTRRDAWMSNDRLSLGLSQPLRVDGGTASLFLPVARTADGSVLRQQERLGLTPSGREKDLQVGYRLSLQPNQSLSFTALTQMDPGHDASSKPEAQLGMHFGLTW